MKDIKLIDHTLGRIAQAGDMEIEIEARDLERICVLALQQVKRRAMPDVSNLLCGSFEPDTTTSSATKCKCGREKWEHPKAT